MMSWNELMNDDIIPYRKSIIENKYQLFKNETKSLADNIINNVITDKTKDLHLTFNDYPYDVEDNIKHYIIWDINLKSFEIKEQLDRYHKFAESNFNPAIYDIIIRINKVKYQSIPEIKHCHLFVRSKNEPSFFDD